MKAKARPRQTQDDDDDDEEKVLSGVQTNFRYYHLPQKQSSTSEP